MSILQFERVFLSFFYISIENRIISRIKHYLVHKHETDPFITSSFFNLITSDQPGIIIDLRSNVAIVDDIVRTNKHDFALIPTYLVDKPGLCKSLLLE